MKQSLLGLAMLLTSWLPAHSAPQTFAHQGSDLQPDPLVRWGRLENGMRYAIMRHGEPPDRISLRLHVAAGSIHETEPQRGLAHFIEHMAFNGTENFTSNELVEFLQTLGFAFGPDLNAYTSFDETVYMLDLPDNNAEITGKCLKVLREWADRITFDPEEIEKERGVILNEKRDRETVEQRLMEEQFKAILPDALLVNRFPIGIEPVIKEARRDEFVRYYETHYTADRMTLVAVGDFDPDEMEAMIKEKFGSMEPADPPAAPPELGGIAAIGEKILYFHDAEVSSTDAGIAEVRPHTPRKDTSQTREDNLRRDLALAMLNRRLERLAREEDAGFVSASAYSFDMLDFFEMASISVTADEDDWQRALTVAETELRRALEHGFTEAEFAEAKANLVRSYEEAVKTRPTARSSTLAMGIVRTLKQNRVFTSPEASLEWLQGVLPRITRESCHAAFQEIWSGEDRVISVTGKSPMENAEETIRKVYEQSKSAAVDAPAEADGNEFAYATIGEPGEITARKEIEDLGITQWTLANGVRVNLKPTEFQKNTISMTARFGGGKLDLPKDRPGLDLFASAVFNGGGLEAHSEDDLQRIFAGKRVGVGFAVGDDAFTLGGSTSPQDLRDQLALLRAYLLHPGYREEAERQFRMALPIATVQMTTTPEGVFGTQGMHWLAGGDNRFAIPNPAALSAHSRDDVRALLAPALASSYLEFSMVGDFQVAEVEQAILETIGALPTRADERPDYAEARIVPPLPEGDKRIEFESQLAKAFNVVVWPGEDMSDIHRARRLNLLGEVLADRVRKTIREEMGDAYSPQVSNSSSDTFKNRGFLIAISPGMPPQSQRVVEAITRVADELAREGTNDEELARARNPLLNTITTQRRNNSYWLGTVLARSQEKPEMLEWARTMIEDYEAITAGEINALAKNHLTADKARRLVISTPLAEKSTPAPEE